MMQIIRLIRPGKPAQLKLRDRLTKRGYRIPVDHRKFISMLNTIRKIVRKIRRHVYELVYDAWILQPDGCRRLKINPFIGFQTGHVPE